jgi:hypothetical protein
MDKSHKQGMKEVHELLKTPCEFKEIGPCRFGKMTDYSYFRICTMCFKVWTKPSYSPPWSDNWREDSWLDGEEILKKHEKNLKKRLSQNGKF